MLKSKELLFQNNEREKQLTKENNQVLTDMIVYLRSSELTELNQEMVRADLIEMVLDAQERGDDIDKVFGESYKDICDDIISAFPKKTRKQKVLDQMDTIFTCIMALSGITVIRGLLAMLVGAHGVMIPISIGDIINAFLISIGACVFVNYFTKHVFSVEDGKEVKTFFKRWVILFAILLIPYGVGMVLKQEVLQLHVAVFLAVCIFALVAERRIAVAKEG